MGNITLLVSKEEMLYQAHNILQEKKYKIQEMRVIQTKDAVMEARNSIASGASIIIARGLQASLMKQYTEIPVVEIVLTAQEMALLIMKAKQIVKKPRPVIAVVGFRNMFCDMSYFDEIYEIELRTYYAASGMELEEMADQAAHADVDLIIGGDTAVAMAAKTRVPSLFLSITEDSLRHAFSMAEHMDYAMGVEKRNAAQMETLLDYSFSGVVNIDAKGMITTLNPMMENMLGGLIHSVGEKKLTEVFPDIDEERIMRVLKDGKQTDSFFLELNKTSVLAVLAPVLIDGSVDGAILTCHKMKKRQSIQTDSRDRKRERILPVLGSFKDLLQESDVMKACVHLAKRYALSEKPILIIGEVGTEKRLLAESIHNESLHHEAPFIPYSCEGISGERQGELLFGDKGACAIGNGGTLYLETIEMLTLENQKRLSDLIRYKIRKTSQFGVEHADMRIIAESSHELERSVREGKLSLELYFLLSALRVNIPPLRKRKEDLRKKIEVEIKESCEQYSRYHVLTSGAYRRLLDYPWQGNSLQVEGFCEHLILTASKRSIDELTIEELWNQLYDTIGELTDTQGIAAENRNVAEEIIPEEQQSILTALKKYSGSRAKAAQSLGISKATLWRHMKKYGISDRLEE